MIKDMLDDIEKAMTAEAYFSALSLALTIPDICGKISYSRIKKDRKKYIKWFNEWIYPYFRITKDEDEEFAKMDELVKFDGEVCYALRCCYLHAGNYKLKNKKNKIKITRFELCISDGEYQFGDSDGVWESSGQIMEVHKSVNIINLLKCFVKGTNDYVMKFGDVSTEYGIFNLKKV